MMPEHCLHRIFFPAKVWATLVCHWQAGHLAVIMEPVAESLTCPSTIGAAAFLGAVGGGGVATGVETGLGGGVRSAVELAAGGGIGCGARGADGAGDATVAAGCTCSEVDPADLPKGMGLPHLGHLTSAGIREGEALIFSFALQLPHSIGIRSISHSF